MGYLTECSSGSGSQSTPVPLTEGQRKISRRGLTYWWYFFEQSNYTEAFCSHSKDNCATVDGFPGGITHNELKFDRVIEELQKVPSREARGEIRRLGDLGYLIFNHLLWVKDWLAFPIGADIEDHRKHRPTADALMGPGSTISEALGMILPAELQRRLPGASAWTRSMVRGYAQAFFREHSSITPHSIDVWVIKLLHKILLDMDLSDQDAQAFV